MVYPFPVFVPLTEVIEGLDAEKRDRWERLHMVSDARNDRSHPLIYGHPITHKPVSKLHQH